MDYSLHYPATLKIISNELSLVHALLRQHSLYPPTRQVRVESPSYLTAMVIYTVTAYTGNRHLAGTNNFIYIKLRGTEDESEEQNLYCFQGFWPGSEQEFKIDCKASLGELITVKLYSKPFMGLCDQWFCDKIKINTPEGHEILFPCYCWLDWNEKLYLRPAKASLVFLDKNIIAQRQRMRQLEEQQKLFRWRVYAEGTPKVIDYDTAATLPPEVQFSFTKDNEFYFTAATQLAALKLTGYADCRNSWESISKLDICGNKSKTTEYCQEHWDEDEFFGYQFLNGLNPMMIQCCPTLPENFPVTDDMVKDSLKGTSLEEEMKKGNIFLSDYKMLDGLVGNVVNDSHQYLAAPLVLLYCNPHGMMLPIAIQLMQKPSKDNPIFLPTDSKADWILAKIFVRNAEFAVHEVDFHLLRTHLLAEVFTVATLRNLPSPHPLHKLLFPHIRYTLQINIMARKQLISKDGFFKSYAGIGGESLEKLLKRATASLTYSALCLPDNISERKLETVPCYYYRDDGMKLWNIINKFVAGHLSHYYQEEKHVQKDTELQHWISEIFTNGFLGRDSSGIPSSFQTLKELIKFVTMVIFTASAQHAAVNSGQKTMENRPVRSLQLSAEKLEQSRGEPRHGRDERNPEGERAREGRNVLISALVPNNPFLPLLLNEYGQEYSLKARPQSPAPCFSMSHAFGEHEFITIPGAPDRQAQNRKSARIITSSLERGSQKEMLWATALPYNSRQQMSCVHEHSDLPMMSNMRQTMETQPECPTLSATSPRWPLESPAREPIPTGCSFSNWPMQSVTLMPDRGSSKTRCCLKLGRYDGHSSYEAFQKKFKLMAEANGWDEAERCSCVASRHFGVITPSMALRQQFQERICQPKESLGVFMADLRHLAHRSYPTFSENVRDALVLGGFDPRSLMAANMNSSAI
ncbi:unnamed protein product [Leuciscus chuanchicus]